MRLEKRIGQMPPLYLDPPFNTTFFDLQKLTLCAHIDLRNYFIEKLFRKLN